MLHLYHATILTPTETIENGAVTIEGEYIKAVGPADQLATPVGVMAIDATGLTLAPGFIDLQLNGAFGLDFTAAPQTIWEVADQLPRYGCTSFLPTVITSPLETMQAAQDVLRHGPPAAFKGAAALGLHLEGPFLNPQKRGAHNPKYLRQPDVNAVHDWSRDNYVCLVTLAPELPCALDVIAALHNRGVVISAGHSMATYEEAHAGFDRGVRYGTHLGNAMTPFDHRAPGLIGALLTDDRPTVGLIPDGIHIHSGLIALAHRSRGTAHINVVTDAMAALGMPPGRYVLGDYEVTVNETSARLSDGRLAGSILSLDQGVRNFMDYTGCTLNNAIATVTTTPAAVLGLTDRGRVQRGAIADLVLLTPDRQVAMTIVRGALAFQKPGFLKGTGF
jgi:N-acetylglucosamine-6-phosphate deacetylase